MRKGAEGKQLEIIKAMLADGKSAEFVAEARQVALAFVQDLAGVKPEPETKAEPKPKRRAASK